jgi:hypothetical protein
MTLSHFRVLTLHIDFPEPHLCSKALEGLDHPSILLGSPLSIGQPERQKEEHHQVTICPYIEKPYAAMLASLLIRISHKMLASIVAMVADQAETQGARQLRTRLQHDRT